MDKLIKKNFNTALLETRVGSRSSYKIEMFSTASAAFRKEFLRKPKTFLAHGPTVQRHLCELNYVNTRSNVDFIWEKSQTVGKSCNDGHVMKQAEILDKLDKLERSSSQFKHSVPAIFDFFARNSYGKFTTTEHSCTLNVSLDVANAQCDCDECFLIHNAEGDEQQSINSEGFQYRDKGTIFWNIQFMINFHRKQSVVTMYPDYYTVKQVIENFDNVKRLFPENPTSKNAFPTVCKVISSDKDLKVINSECEYGGLIGPGNSRLYPLLQNFKLFRVHAAFHDASGFMKMQYNLGPGYVYALGEKPFFKNCCLLGHVTGLSVWIYLNLTMSENYKELPF